MAQEDKSLTSEGYETEFYIESETEEEEFFEGKCLLNADIGDDTGIKHILNHIS